MKTGARRNQLIIIDFRREAQPPNVHVEVRRHGPLKHGLTRNRQRRRGRESAGRRGGWRGRDHKKGRRTFCRGGAAGGSVQRTRGRGLRGSLGFCCGGRCGNGWPDRSLIKDHQRNRQSGKEESKYKGPARTQRVALTEAKICQPAASLQGTDTKQITKDGPQRKEYDPDECQCKRHFANYTAPCFTISNSTGTKKL